MDFHGWRRISIHYNSVILRDLIPALLRTVSIRSPAHEMPVEPRNFIATVHRADFHRLRSRKQGRPRISARACAPCLGGIEVTMLIYTLRRGLLAQFHELRVPLKSGETSLSRPRLLCKHAPRVFTFDRATGRRWVAASTCCEPTLCICVHRTHTYMHTSR